MPVTHTNRKGRTYFLCQGITRTGKPRYYFALEPKAPLVGRLPDGYQVQESVNGIVSLVRTQPNLLSPEDIAVVEATLQAHPQARRYQVSVKSKQITIYEQVGPDLAELTASFGRVLKSDALERLETSYAQFRPIMRFILTDNAGRLFTAQRMCFRGNIDDWINLEYDQLIPPLAARLIPTLGTDNFYELF
jgi:hypothetical protein